MNPISMTFMQEDCLMLRLGDEGLSRATLNPRRHDRKAASFD